jgi:hypothetical protein
MLTQLVIVLLLVTALTQPYWKSVFAGRRNMVLLLDVSASMSATDVKPTRFARAQEEARRIIQDVGRGERLAILAAGSTVRTVCRFTDDRAALQAACDGVQPTDGASRVAEAAALARRLLADCSNPHIFVLTDGCFAEAKELAQSENVQLLLVGERGKNVAISHFQARPALTDPAQLKALVDVANFSDEAVQSVLEVRLADGPPQTEKLELAAGATVQRVLTIAAAKGGLLTAKLSETDDLLSDNTAAAWVSSGPRPQVLLVGEIPSALEAIFKANPRFGCQVVPTLPASLAAGTIPVFYRKVPQDLATGPALVLEPQASCKLWDVQAAADADVAWAVKETKTGSPLLAGVSFESYVVDQAARVTFKSSAETLVTAASGEPLYSDLKSPQAHVLVLHVNLEKSDLLLRSDFPQLIDNAIQWLQPAVAVDRTPVTTDEVVEFVPSSEPRTVGGQNGSDLKVVPQQNAVVLDRVGVWPAAQGQSTAQAALDWLADHRQNDRWVVGGSDAKVSRPLRLASNLANPRESDLRRDADLRAGQFVESKASAEQPVWMLLVRFALVALVAEWCLFHRRVIV